MAYNKGRKGKSITLKWLERRLYGLPKVEASEALKDELLSAIPDGAQKTAYGYQAKRRPRVWDFGAAVAAASLILFLMLTVKYGLSVSSQMSVTELNDTSLYYTK